MRVRCGCAGTAPDGLRFELGVRGLLPPLLTFAPGERLAPVDECASAWQGE
jgi:hypothetical protein